MPQVVSSLRSACATYRLDEATTKSIGLVIKLIRTMEE